MGLFALAVALGLADGPDEQVGRFHLMDNVGIVAAVKVEHGVSADSCAIVPNEDP